MNISLGNTKCNFLLRRTVWVILLQMVTPTLTSFLTDDVDCPTDYAQEESYIMDMAYMFTASDLKLLMQENNSPQFVPGLAALLHPYISLWMPTIMDIHNVDKSKLKVFKIVGSKGNYFKAVFGSPSLKLGYSTDFTVHADPVIKLSGSFIIGGLTISFLEYNATIDSIDYIGYNLNLTADILVDYMIAIETEGTKARITLHQELSGYGSIQVQDSTNCELLEKFGDINLGRICGHQMLDEVMKWKGLGQSMIKFVRPIVLNAVFCSVKKMAKTIIETTAAYTLILRI